VVPVNTLPEESKLYSIVKKTQGKPVGSIVDEIDGTWSYIISFMKPPKVFPNTVISSKSRRFVEPTVVHS